MNNHHTNSMEAFRAIEPQLPARRAEVLRTIARFPAGLTAEQVARHMRRPQHTISGRLTELKKDGHIIQRQDANGNPVRRQTISGNRATVYIINPKITKQ